MKVIHVITGLADGGAEASLFRLCVASNDHRHFVVSLGDEGKYGPMLRASGVGVECLGMPRGRVTPAALSKLFRVLRRERPDVVQCWMYHANLLGGVIARLAGIRAVLWGMHKSDLDPKRSSRGTRIVSWVCSKLSATVPAAIISCSQRAADLHIASGYAADGWTIVPNGYNTETFAPDETVVAPLREEWSVGPDETVIGMVARWNPQKDHRNLIEALSLLEKREHAGYRCILAGTGLTDDNHELTRLIDDHGLAERVLLLGPRADIVAVMNALDVHVLSSRFGEAFPNVVAEAMACGTPCVVTDVGDAAVIVGETGWVVPPANPEALATALEEALTAKADAASWTDRSSRCRARIVDRYSIARIAQAYEAAWEQVQPVGGAKPKGRTDAGATLGY